MKLFEPIYLTIMQWARHRLAERYLAAMSFAESSFMPIPVDIMLAPMVLAQPDKAWRLATITTLTSVLGGVFGYLVGYYFFDLFGEQILSYFAAHETFAQVQESYTRYGMMIILLAGFTPIPYKIFTIASGVLGIAIIPFTIMSFLGRGARFFLVAALVRFGGETLESTILAKVELLGWISLVLTGVLVGAYFFF